MPPVTVTGFDVQESVAPGDPAPGVIASATCVVLSPATVFPAASLTTTRGCVANAVPPVELLGCCVNPSCVAEPMTVTTGLVAIGAGDPELPCLVAVANVYAP